MPPVCLYCRQSGRCRRSIKCVFPDRVTRLAREVGSVGEHDGTAVDPRMVQQVTSCNMVRKRRQGIILAGLILLACCAVIRPSRADSNDHPDAGVRVVPLKSSAKTGPFPFSDASGPGRHAFVPDAGRALGHSVPILRAPAFRTASSRGLRRLPSIEPPAAPVETIPAPVSRVMKEDVAEDHPKPLPLPLREPFEASRYGDRIRQFVESVGPVPDPILISQIPPGYQPWWQTRSLGTLRPGVEAAPVDLEHLLVSALSFSPHIQAARQLAGSRMTAITEAKSEFDVRSFVESRFVRTSDPVGNTLTTGGPGRFRDQTWKHDAGVRKRNSLGGSMEVSQQFGFQDNNSEFLIPKQQGTSRLVLRFE